MLFALCTLYSGTKNIRFVHDRFYIVINTVLSAHSVLLWFFGRPRGSVLYNVHKPKMSGTVVHFSRKTLTKFADTLSRCFPEVSEGRKSISDFISEFSHLPFAYFLMVIWHLHQQSFIGFANKKYWKLIPIFRLSTCRWSLALILWGFEVHTSTTTSQSDSFKLLLEMILWSIFYFAIFFIFLGIFIWIDHHPSRQRFQHKCWAEIGERCAKLKSDIDLGPSLTSGQHLEVLRLKFWSSGNAWKYSKYGGKQREVSVRKCDQTIPTLLSSIISIHSSSLFRKRC